MSKIIALGSMNSGKTAYLIGMYKGMRNMIENLFLIAKDDGSDLQLDNLWEKMIEKGTPPDPTPKPKEFNFCLARGYKPMCDIDWIEYGVDLHHTNFRGFNTTGKIPIVCFCSSTAHYFIFLMPETLTTTKKSS